MTRRPFVHYLAVLVAASCITLAVGASSAQASELASTSSLTASTSVTGLRVTNVTYDAVSLSWDASSTRVLYYLIYRDGLWVNSSYGTTGSVGFLAAGSTHTIEVRARRTDNSLSDAAGVVATTLADSGPPSTPQNLRVVTDATGTPSGLTWDASTDDRGIRSYVLTADNSPVFYGGPEVSFYTLTEEYCAILAGQTYTFSVYAVDLSGYVSATGSQVTVAVP
jgi:hypothetical protein